MAVRSFRVFVRQALVALVLAACSLQTAFAYDWQIGAGRYFGFGWSDGYHARTAYGPSCGFGCGPTGWQVQPWGPAFAPGCSTCGPNVYATPSPLPPAPAPAVYDPYLPPRFNPAPQYPPPQYQRPDLRERR